MVEENRIFDVNYFSHEEFSSCVKYHYKLLGDPIAWSRTAVNFSKRKIWDAQKQLKFGIGVQLNTQHKLGRLLDGPIHVNFLFCFPLPKTSLKRQALLKGAYYYEKPDVDNLIKLILDVSKNIIITDDKRVASTYFKKIYDDIPRTEFSIMEIK